MSVPKKLYRSLSRLIRDADHHGIPVVGVAGLPAFPISCNARSTLRALFSATQDDRRPRLTEDDAFLALRLLRRQIQTLRAADEETTQALGRWSALLAHQRRRTAQPMSSDGVLHGVEDGAMLVYRLHRDMDGELFEDEAIGDTEGAVIKTVAVLDGFAEAAKAGRPQVFTSNSLLHGSVAPADLKAQLSAISEALFGGRRLRCEPVEWVYDGLSPLLLPELLLREWRDGASGGRGVPLSVALVYCCVARRLGVPVGMFKASESNSSTATGPVNLQGVPTEVAGRQAGRTVAAPSVDTWFVAARSAPPSPPSPSPPSHADAGTGRAGGFIDRDGASPSAAAGAAAACVLVEVESRRPGSLLTPDDVLTRFPDAADRLKQLVASSTVRMAGSATATTTGAAVAAATTTGAPHTTGVSSLAPADTASTPRTRVPPEGGTQEHAPAVQRAATGAQAVGHGESPSAAAAAGQRDARRHEAELVGVLAELARAMVSAHQRRGESDLVAYWLYQVLALDPAAPEWQHVMHSDDVGT